MLFKANLSENIYRIHQNGKIEVPGKNFSDKTYTINDAPGAPISKDLDNEYVLAVDGESSSYKKTRELNSNFQKRKSVGDYNDITVNLISSTFHFGNETQYNYCYEKVSKVNCNTNFALVKCEGIRQKFGCEKGHVTNECRFRYKNGDKKCCLKYTCFNSKESDEDEVNKEIEYIIANKPVWESVELVVKDEDKVKEEIKSVMKNEAKWESIEMEVKDDNGDSILSKNLVRYYLKYQTM